jgi:type I restriction enzyme S subunit
MTDWPIRRLGELLSYEQPGRYLVSSTDYLQAGGVPVLTAGKTFVLGYTSESWGVYRTLPVIIFDDFTTASKYVTFPFKAKSSAMKMLKARSGVNLRFVYERMQLINFPIADHKRRWITEFSKLEIPTPSLEEQQQIAGRIADCDDLIASLEGLIAKKRNIKQGLMQELLTGRTRLPGFKGDWVDLRVANASHLKARIGWQGLKTGEYQNSGEYRLVGGTDFRAGRVNWESTPFVDKWRYDQDKNIQLQEGDVLITKDGTIGKVALVENLPGPATLNSGVFVLRPKHDAYDPRFIFVMLRSRFFEEFVAGLSAGSTINHLYQKDLVTLILTVPSAIEEQKAIARVLLDADDEIAALERRLESARAIKQGMMQELLTGRTRLAEEVAA